MAKFWAKTHVTGFMALRYQFSGELEDNMSKYWISGPEFGPGISKMTSVNASTQHNIEYALVFHGCYILRHIHCTLYMYITPTLCFSIIPLFIATTMDWTIRDRIPVGTRFSARPDRPWGPPSIL